MLDEQEALKRDTPNSDAGAITDAILPASIYSFSRVRLCNPLKYAASIRPPPSTMAAFHLWSVSDPS